MDYIEISRKLNTIKQVIDDAEANYQRMEGQIQEMEEVLKRDFHINSWEDAAKEVARLEEERQKLEVSIQARVNRLYNAVGEYVGELTSK